MRIVTVCHCSVTQQLLAVSLRIVCCSSKVLLDKESLLTLFEARGGTSARHAHAHLDESIRCYLGKVAGVQCNHISYSTGEIWGRIGSSRTEMDRYGVEPSITVFRSLFSVYH
ncbi:hypothetical protein TRVL_02699 [Trypanosoma vivax]|nr:hypothetical protein TRVL_02699 [Trypanosoma vivax]